MNDSLDQKLRALHRDNQPDERFATQLEQQLRFVHKPSDVTVRQFPHRFLRQVATVVASLVLIAVLIMTVPPLRSLAENLIQFFVPGYGYMLPGDEGAYTDTVTVTTVAEAEAIAGFEALQWMDSGFNVIHVSAAEGYLHTAYEHESDRGALMILIQWRTGSYPDQTPIDPNAEVIHTTIHGVEAQFVSGAPFGENPVWLPDHYRQLRWEVDGMSYHLRVSSSIARTLEQTLVIAEKFQ